MSRNPSADGRVHTGVDVVSIDRIEGLLDRFPESFVRRIFTPTEADYCHTKPFPPQHFAARWAAKEATVKALPRSEPPIRLRDVGIVRCGDRPELAFTGTAAAAVRRLGGTECSVSLSHDRSAGIAMAGIVLLATNHAGGDDDADTAIVSDIGTTPESTLDTTSNP